MERHQKLFYKMGAHILLKPILEVGFDLKASGLENIPKRGKFLIASTHRSWTDPILIAAEIERPINFLAASFTFYIPVIKDAYKRAGVIPLYSGEKRNEGSLKKCIRLLMQGKPVGVFPEGVENFFSSEGEKVKIFHTGFVRIALATASPVIPCAVVAKEEVPQPQIFDKLMKLHFPKMPKSFNPNLKIIYYGKGIRIKIGKPMDLSSYYHLMHTKELLNHIAGKVRREVVRLRKAGERELEIQENEKEE